MKKAVVFLILCLAVLLTAGMAENALPAPEDIPPLPAGENTGSLRVQAFNDKNGNGYQGNYEDGIPGVAVYLMQGDDVIAGARTDDLGMAVFGNVPAGLYTTRTLLPDDWTFSRKGEEGRIDANAYDITVEAYGVSPEIRVEAGMEAVQGIALQTAYYVSGFCWEEARPADGLYTDQDKLLGGVRITLDGNKNGLHYETLSNPDGTWRISRVHPALYTLTVHVPEGLMFTKYSPNQGTRSVLTLDGVTKGSKMIDLNDRVSKERQNFGFRGAGSVRGICYIDSNYNGYYDEGEKPLPGVKMTVVKNTDEHLMFTMSGEDGRFILTGLKANTYKIKATLPDDGSDFTVTADGDLGNHFAARPGRRENFWVGFTVGEEESREIAVGAIYPATVKGTVYMDDDFSGTLSGKEQIVSNYLVSIKDTTGKIILQDKTSVKGVYEITDVPPGRYRLTVQAVNGYAFTKAGEGSVILNLSSGAGQSEEFQVENGSIVSGMDIGMIRPGKVEGDVFADRNDNGLRDENESGMEGAAVRLMTEEGEEAFRAEIPSTGHFLFDAVMPGRYYVEYVLPENSVIARTVEGGNAVPGEGTSGRTEVFEFASGGYQKAPLCGMVTLGRVDGIAYQDHNGNGQRDAGEDALSGMTVRLIPSREELAEITAVTDAEGVYLLDNLRPDTYTLDVTCPDGFVMSRTDSLELPLTAGINAQQAELPLPMGNGRRTGQAIGAVIPAAIRGRVWLDENNNGLFDEGELTPEGLTITVMDESTDTVFDTPRTDGEGYFTAAGMIPGRFAVTYQLAANTVACKPGDSQFTERDGRLELTGIELKENELCDNLLLGMVRFTEISGRAWILRGAGEESLSGTEIILTDENGAEAERTLSGEDGTYRFPYLMPGVYRLNVTVPEGCVIIEPGDDRLNDSLRSVITDTVNRRGSSEPLQLVMGQDQTGMDIGCVLPGAIGDVCWLDLDEDGLQGAGEGGIAGVRIEAIRDGNVVAETTTDAWGFYRLPDLYPAVYTLRVTPPAEVMPTRPRTDVPLIVSVLERTEDPVCYAFDVTVLSDVPNYNADLGFVLRNKGVLPTGYGEAPTQKWQ